MLSTIVNFVGCSSDNFNQSDFEIETSKKVTVEVKSQTQFKKPIIEAKVKITNSEQQHVINLLKLLVKEKLGGATTVIAPVKADIVSGLIIGQDQTLGIRVPDHHFCNKLASKYLKPVITTSVNRSGDDPATIPDKIESQFSNEVELLVDDGIINQGGSTIYLLRDKNWKILRS